jgi:nitroreductase
MHQSSKWFEEEGTWRTLENANPKENKPGGFVTDASGKPSEEDLKTMLHMASLAVTSGGKTDWYMVAVTDPEEQMKIIGDKYGVATSEGTATVLVFGERLLRPDVRTDGDKTYQPDRGYYDAWIVSGYLNIAAISLGYGTPLLHDPCSSWNQ